MPSLIADPLPQEFLATLAERHDHLCPRQVLGLRMGMYMSELLPMQLPQTGKRLLTFVETDGCFADALSVATGCSLGHRTMRLVDHGKVAAVFVDTQTGKSLRCWPAPGIRDRAALEVPTASNRWQAQLEGYQRMANERLFIIREVRPLLDVAAIIGRPGTRATCSLCGEEILNQREVEQNGQIVCRGCASEAYWAMTGMENQ